MSILLGATALILSACCYTAFSSHKAELSRKQARAEKIRAAARAAPTDEVEEDAGLMSAEMMADVVSQALQQSDEIVKRPTRKMKNLTKTLVAKELDRLIWSYRLIALATMQGISKMTSRAADVEAQRNLANQAVVRLLESLTPLVVASFASSKDVESTTTTVKEALSVVSEILELHPALLGKEKTPISEVLAGDPKGPWELGGTRHQDLEGKTASLLPTFVKDAKSLDQRTPQAGHDVSFPRVRRFPLAYGAVLSINLAIIVSFMIKVGQGNDAFQGGVGPGDACQVRGMGKTYFSLPPYYDLNSSTVQAFTVPLTYACMHSALFFLGLLPLPICRGLWRDIVARAPVVRRVLPVDDFETIHRHLGFLTLAYVAIGATAWILSMGAACMAGSALACLAFDPALPNFFNPIENVVMLRFIIWPTWFLLIPLMYWARQVPKALSGITFFRRYWFEICFYAHLVVALVTLTLALVGRFCIFYPVILGWGFYFIDRARERLLHARRAEVVEAECYSRSDRDQPTSVHLQLKPSSDLRVTAGQWLYLQIPAIGHTWHPFSICSASADENIHFHIGVRAVSEGDWVEENGTYVLSHPTWTSKLAQHVLHAEKKIQARVMGPYGTSFVSCFDPSYSGCIVIGAGTGLTAAESVIRELLFRKRDGIAVPKRVWFVWSCRCVDDLMWCWERLLSLLQESIENGVLSADGLRTTGSMLDWLGITIYISRAKQSELKALHDMYAYREGEMVMYASAQPVGALYGASAIGLARQTALIPLSAGKHAGAGAKKKVTVSTRQVARWLLTRLVSGSLDNPDTHVEHLIRSAQLVVKQGGSGRGTSAMSLCFCGPSGLATTLSEAAARISSDSGSDGLTLEFSSDHQ
jgi:ferredoxin-NADP reductase